MVISVSPKLWERALNGEREIINTITQLLIWVDLGKHIIIFENIEVEHITSSPYFSHFSETIQAFFIKQFYESNNNKVIIRVTENASLPNITNQKICFDGKLIISNNLRVEHHYLDYLYIETYLSRPLYIVVENSDSDKAFVKTAYSSIINSNIPIEYTIANPLDMDLDTRIEFRLGGGNTTRTVIKSFIYPTRAICIIDSDKKYPSHELQNKTIEVAELCEERNFDIIILNKREIENYLPNEAISTWLSNKRRYAELDHLFFSFNELQRSYFDLKKGMKFQEYSEISEIKSIFDNVFSSVDPVNYSMPNSKLLDGFGSDVWQAFTEVACQAEHFSAETIEEFVGIVNKIHCKV